MMKDQVQKAWKWLKDNAAPVAVVVPIISAGWTVYNYIYHPKLTLRLGFSRMH